MATKKIFNQSGLALVTLIFLILVGALLLSSMAYLYGAAATGQAVQNGGAQAFLAAESGDQYGVYYLATQYATTLPPSPLTVTAPWVTPSACLAPVVTITATTPLVTYTVSSVATCPGVGARWTVTRTVSVTVTGTAGRGNQGVGGGGQKGKPSGYSYAVTGWTEQ